MNSTRLTLTSTPRTINATKGIKHLASCIVGVVTFVLQTQVLLGQVADVWTPGAVNEPRSAPAMAFDDARGRGVMFGGFNGSIRSDETWEWDGAGWTRRNPPVRPPARRDHVLVYDAVRQRVVMFGGNGAAGNLADTWEWDGTSWTQAATTLSPSARDGHAMAFDIAANRTILFGGQNSTGAFADTWLWDGSVWTLVAPPTAPKKRALGAMAYDKARQRAVLFGGGDGAVNFAETWEWDGATWRKRRRRPCRPLGGDTRSRSTRRAAGSCSSAEAPGRRSLPTPGSTAETAGSRLQPAVSPPARDRNALLFDPVRARVLLFGGRGATATINFADTWEWDGIAWMIRASSVVPLPRSRHAMTHDGGRQTVLLFGGLGATGVARRTRGSGAEPAGRGDFPPRSRPRGGPRDGVRRPARAGRDLRRPRRDRAALADTWEWDGPNWTSPNPGTTPSPRSGHALVFDPARGRIVLFGGLDALTSTALADTWEWDGADWQQLTPPVDSARAHRTCALPRRGPVASRVVRRKRPDWHSFRRHVGVGWRAMESAGSGTGAPGPQRTRALSRRRSIEERVVRRGRLHRELSRRYLGMGRHDLDAVGHPQGPPRAITSRWPTTPPAAAACCSGAQRPPAPTRKRGSTPSPMGRT